MSEGNGRSRLDRRGFLGTGSALVAALAGQSAAEAQQRRGERGEQEQDGRSDKSAADIGPENTLLRDAQPNSFVPPRTDHGEVPAFWNSFSAAHRRIQPGGWTRQVTIADFPLSKDIAGVNMRLTAGGCRELHWHNAGEWALMLKGNARITALDADGKGFVDDVSAGDLWFFPTGIPHSIQGLAPDGCEFLLVFDDAAFSEADTTLISDWTRHTPREVLAKNWNLPETALQSIYAQPADGHFIFQLPVPGTLDADRRATAGEKGLSPSKFSFSLRQMAPTVKRSSGEVKIIDKRNFPVSDTIAAAHVVIKPGGMRELHWHQNADEWQYYIQGKARMTVFFNGSKARTADFLAGDIGVVPKTLGHYVENVGDTDLIFLEMFKSDRYQDLSLSEWVRNAPPELISQHLGIGPDVMQKIPKEKAVLLPL